MPTIIYEDREAALVDAALTELQSKTDITQLSPGAKARALVEITSRETNNAYRYFDQELLQVFVKYASGQNLDLLGELVGISRYKATRAEIDSGTQVQKFYVQGGGTFGSINSGSSITIPAGTEVRTRVTPDTDTEAIKYRIIEDLTCSSSARTAYASIESIEYGTVSHVGQGMLVLHNFENYSDYLNASLKTTNLESITYAREDESDDNFRYRIINQTLAAETANSVAIRMAGLSVPGVRDIMLDEYAYGIGTGAVYVESTVVPVSTNLLEVVQSQVDRVKAFGSDIIVKAPTAVGVEIAVTLNLYKLLSPEDDEDLRLRVIDHLYKYINDLGISISLEAVELEKEILSVDSNIKSIGTTVQPIDELYIWKYSYSEDNRRSYKIVNDYSTYDFERLMVEFGECNGRDPVRVRTRKEEKRIV